MVTITSGELQKKFGLYRDMALKQPVTVTDDGRNSLVVLSAEEYDRLKALDSRKAVYPWELDEEMMAALDQSAAPGFTARYDEET